MTDWKKNEIILQDGETSDYLWVTKEQLKGMKSNELLTDRMQLFIEELR